MISKKKLLKKSRLYLIADKKVLARRTLIKKASLIKDSRIGIIQLRDKESGKAEVLREAIGLSRLLGKNKPIFIVNDYPDIAKLADSDGVHLGQSDPSVKIARRILGKDKIIGV